ncbi:uncharacterized protein LOC105283902 isoform X2 [Ooceraea biroi]|uniref:uncharacterized protein LOC105283902 isoform X2 n=1 Tax=Ooceraea biroi TaxID=2015173 RepID=UPI000F08EA7A|nr:uncharacterized protein LOC105283902 isoform X2 [Ooceraea biroi]
MVFVGERCYKLHRIMLIALGLWPYQKPFIWRMQAVFFFSAHCCNFFFQFTAFLTTTCNTDCILKRFSYICIGCVYAMNYYSFYFNSESIKQMLEHIQLDWKMFKNSDTIKTFEEYLFVSYVFILFGCIVVCIGVFGFAAIECRPVILDVIIPMNESRPRKVEVDMEIFVDKEQYFFLYIMEEVVSLGIGLFSVITTGTFLATIAEHCCATYKIASCLIESTVTIHTLAIPVDQKIQFMHRSICLSVYIHRRTMEFVKRIVHSFDLWYLPLCLIAVLSLSCLLFRLYNAIINTNDWYDILVCCVLVYAYLIYMFVGNFLAQSYTEHSAELLESTYNCLWYIAPLPIQKLFLLMQKATKSHKVVMGGLFTLSVEGFSTIRSDFIDLGRFAKSVNHAVLLTPITIGCARKHD